MDKSQKLKKILGLSLRENFFSVLKKCFPNILLTKNFLGRSNLLLLTCDSKIRFEHVLAVNGVRFQF